MQKGSGRAKRENLIVGRILAIDYGEKRIGLAMTDEARIISSPFDVWKNDAALFERFDSLFNDFNIDLIIIGLPYSEKYKEAENNSRQFADNLRRVTLIPIEFQNEENTTVYATTLLKTMGYNEKKIKDIVDKYSAQKILADYMEHTSTV